MENNQTTKHNLKGKFCGIYVRHHVSIPCSLCSQFTFRNPDILKEIHEAVKNLQEVESEGLIIPDADQSFLLVLQTKQQSKWLQQYGNTITCMDATYKTLWYGFLCVVKTALGIGRGWHYPSSIWDRRIYTGGVTEVKQMEPRMISSVFMTDKSAQELGTHLVCGCAVYYEPRLFSVPNPDSISSHCPSVDWENTVCTTVCVKMLSI